MFKKIYGPFDNEIQPGDLYMRVPFVFPTPEWEFLRETNRGQGDWRVYFEGDLPGGGGPLPVERVSVERRSVYAMLHPEFPPCQIDKVLPPSGRALAFSDDHVLTMFHCVERKDIKALWEEILKHPERHKRFGLLGEVTLPDGKVTELAVSFRRSQQIFAKHVKSLARIASPLVKLDPAAIAEGDAPEPADGLEAILGLYGRYMSEGQDE